MNVLQFVYNDKHAIRRRLLTFANKVEEISLVEIPDPQTIILEGNVFDLITAIYYFRIQYINLGLAWDIIELTFDPKKPYYAHLSYKVAKENYNNQLKFNVKVKDYGKEN